MLVNTVFAAVHIHSPEMCPQWSVTLSHSCYYHLVSLPAGVTRERVICEI